MAATSFDTRREDWATRLLAPLGLMTVMAAAAAFIVAGVYSASTFGTGLSPSELARHHGVATSTAAWAMPLALAGITAIFSGIAVALARIRISIRGRRDALAYSLPRILQPTN
jgi:beta-lactamase regulating signal transducer with metallopeptidase domain